MGFFRPFALERYFAKHEFSARYLMCSSDCESFPVRELLAMEDESLDRLLDQRLGYTETRGAPSLRSAIAAHYAGLSADAVVVHSGAEEAILNLCLATLKPGDEVIVNAPCYQSLAEIPRAIGCTVKSWEFREVAAKNGTSRWFLDPDDLPALSAGKAKMIILNAPHNPTGALPTRRNSRLSSAMRVRPAPYSLSMRSTAGWNGISRTGCLQSARHTRTGWPLMCSASTQG